MNLLEEKIIQKIREDGPITFETFMEMALYEQGLGYYAKDTIEIGKSGDYYTSQHLHPAFGAMLGKQLEEMWTIMGKPSVFHAVEPGAGEGYMCKDILDYLKGRELFPFLRYVIVEPHPFMQQKQQKLLDNFSAKIQWTASLSKIDSFSGCILSNELLDAFPVHLITMNNGLKEIYVTVADNHIIETTGAPSTPALSDYLRTFPVDLPDGYRTEINLRIKDWLNAVNHVLSEGFILSIDYGYPVRGYYSEDRDRGTLLCYYKHQVNENMFQHIGEQDITAHVNFSSVKKWGEEYGFRTVGFCNQGTYLVSLGIDTLIGELHKHSGDYLFEVARIKRLLLPGTIGETHKVLIQYKGNGNPELRGFLMKNQEDKL
jgi:SAM-dependent MidA family methyltransferase